MGLDITVYKNCKIATKEELKINEEIGNIPIFRVYVLEDHWKSRISKIHEYEYYTGESSYRFSGYPYSSHFQFRQSLMEIFGIKTEDVWNNPMKYLETPFYELVDFADNEGCMDWVTSKSLYKDFVNHEKTYLERYKPSPYLINKYMDWKDVFKFGKKKNSIVVFH